MLTTDNPFSLPRGHYAFPIHSQCQPVPAQIPAPLGHAQCSRLQFVPINQDHGNRPLFAPSLQSNPVVSGHRLNDTVTALDHRRFKCSYCWKRYETMSILRKHLRKHETKIRPFECGICGKAFAKEAKMRKHHRRRHLVEMTSGDQPSMRANAENEQQTPRQHEKMQTRDTTSTKGRCGDGKDNGLIPVSNCYYCSVCDKIIRYKLRHKHCGSAK